MADTADAPKKESSSEVDKVRFVPKKGTTRVVMNVASEDKPVVVDEKGVEVEAGSTTALALADHPLLKQD